MQQDLFRDISPICLNHAKETNNSTIIDLYSNFTFLYLYNNSVNEEDVTDQIITFLEKYKFITYRIFKINNSLNLFQEMQVKSDNSTEDNANIIICVENICLIINNIDLQFIEQILEEKEMFSINVEKPNTIVNVEIKSFIDEFSKYLKQDFLKHTIKPIVCYMIRRFYYPSYFFNDQSFFIFNKNDQNDSSLIRQNIRRQIEDLFYTNNDENEINKNIKIQKIVEENNNVANNNKHEICEFNINDFITLRNIHSKDTSSISLIYHKKKFHIFVLKKYLKDKTDIKNKREINYVFNYNHRCLNQCYGLMKDNTNKLIGFVYEFMSNGTIEDYIKANKDKTDCIFSYMAMVRIFEGIKYLHSNKLIHRDLKPSNIFLDHDFLPFIGDYDTLRNMENNTKSFTNDIGAVKYVSPEQFNGAKVSYPTDIFSFGLIIYFLFTKGKEINFDPEYKYVIKGNIPKIEKITSNIENIYLSCLKYDPSERITLENIEKLIQDDINLNFYIDKYLEQTNELNINALISYLQENVLFILTKPNKLDLYVQNVLNQELISLWHYIDNKKTFNRFLSIGLFYKKGIAVSKNYTKARKWFELAAKQNNLKATYYLGTIYLKGLEVDKDHIKAEQYFEIIAKQNDSNILYDIGKCFLKNRGNNPVFSTLCKKYFKLSAKLENRVAFFALGLLYYYDAEIKKTKYFKAKKYFELAAEKNFTSANYYLGLIFLNGFGVEKDYTKARENFEIAANDNDEDALFYLGFIYGKGYGVEQDYRIAKKCFKLAADKNHYEAQYNLGILYYNGFGVKQNYLKAKKYLKLAANKDHPDAQFQLGVLYYCGIGAKQDYFKAKKYFELAAKKNYSNAQFNLGFMYYNACGVQQDYLKAKEYFELAAHDNNTKALYFLGKMHINGFGIKKNIQEGMKYLNLAAEQNDIDSYSYLLDLYIMGYGTEDDYIKTKNFFLSIENQNNPEVLCSLGVIYLFGIGDQIDYPKAAYYFKTALKYNNYNMIALFYLFYINFLGLGMKQNLQESLNFLKIFIQQLKENKINFFESMIKNCELIKWETFKKIFQKNYQIMNTLIKNNKNILNWISDEFYNNIQSLYNSIKCTDHSRNKILQILDGTIEMLYTLCRKNINKIDTKKYAPSLFHASEYMADVGESDSLNNLGTLYYHGLAVERNYEKAKNYFELSAKQNNSLALLNLGYFYENVCPKDYLKAIQYYKESVNLNNAIAMNTLGKRYEKGLVIKQNYKKAYKYYCLSAKQNDTDGLYYLGKLYLKGFGVEKNNLTAIDYFTKSATKNNSKALVKLGTLYSRGIIVKKDYLLAKKYFELASLQNNPSSYFFIGDLYSNGEYFNVDLPEAIKNFEKCIEFENGIVLTYKTINDSIIAEYRNNKYKYRSYNDLGLIYLIFYQDINRAKEYLKISSCGEYPFGQNNFGLLSQFYLNNIGDAKHVFEKASNVKFALAQYNLGYFYESEGSIEKAIEYYISASENEDQPIKFHSNIHYDNRCEISKTYIICLTNLLLTRYYLSQSDHQNAKQYFIKSFTKLISNDDQFNYHFNFNIEKDEIITYLKNFIFNFPKFNFIKQPKLFNDLQKNDIQLFIHNDSKEKCPLTSDSITKSNIINKCQINIKMFTGLNNKKNNSKYLDLFKKIHSNDFSKHNDHEIIQKLTFINNSCLKEKKENDQKEILNKKDSLNKRIIKEPSDLFDMMLEKDETKNTFVECLNDLIQTMRKILYTPPYNILFGRIYTDRCNSDCEKSRKENSNTNFKDINDLFYKGFS